MTTIPFAKGHGARNDFVLIPAFDGERDVTPEQVAFLCDRRSGLGGDGVIRVVRAGVVDDDRARAMDPQTWYMDYRNADGSIGEMCGNGTRVIAEYLRSEGLVEDAPFDLGTRNGVRRMTPGPDGFQVDLGTWRLPRADIAQERGMDCVVQTAGATDPLPGLSVDVGNPHTVVMLPESVPLVTLDLTTAPQVDPRPEQGSNVELVRAIGPCHIAMRVHERGVGETEACGTGAAAAVVATWWWGGRPADQTRWQVDVPGGTLHVRLDGERVLLAGPAVVLARGEVRLPL